MNSAMIYVRSSTNNKECINRQIENCRKFAQENRMVILETYVDTDTSFVQQESLIEDCKARKFRNVITYSLDRLSRNSQDVTILLKTFEENNVKIFFSTENIRVPFSSFQIGILESMANCESRIREERELINSSVQPSLPA